MIISKELTCYKCNKKFDGAEPGSGSLFASPDIKRHYCGDCYRNLSDEEHREIAEILK